MNEITISRHAAQEMMQRSLETMPRPCLGLLAGHGCHVEAAMPLAPSTVTPDTSRQVDASDAQAIAAKIRLLGFGIIGWFHSRTDAHEPDPTAMRALEQLSASMSELALTSAVPIHLLVALDMKGRLDLYAYALNPKKQLVRAPLRLMDDTPLYLRSPRR